MLQFLRHLLVSLKMTILLRNHWVNPISAFRFMLCVHCQSIQAEMLTKFKVGDVPFLARPQDWFTLEEILLEAEYDFIEHIVDKPSLNSVVDVGANIGLFSIYILSKWPSVKMYSIEPSQSTYQILEQNRKLNPNLNWQTFRYALWKHNGHVNFENKEYSTGSRINLDLKTTEIVPAINLPTLLSKCGVPVDVMKLDIEGAEEAVLTDNQDTLQSINTLIIEIHPHLCNQERIVTILREIYNFLYYIPNRRSSKPLLVASHKAFSLPIFRNGAF